MQLNDLTKDIRRILLEHWTENEINSRLEDPEYFFEQIVNPHLLFLRRSGERIPLMRLKKNPKGETIVLLKP